MKFEDARDLLEAVFSSSYSRDNFKQLSRELFISYDKIELPIIHEKGIKSIAHLGLFEDDNSKKIGIFEVELDQVSSLNNARVNQRNIIGNQLKIYNYESALCSFYHPNKGEWRLSFITRKLSRDISSGKIKFLPQLSPARRQSFIAGPNEGTHTAKKQFLPRIQSDNKPSFDDIASIFEIEAVNDDFYDQYEELYLKLTEELEQFMDKDPVIAADFQEKEVSASDFAKKTLGQFVFLYFLQRKGWIKDKVHPDEIFSFSKLFDDKKRFGDNFFNDLMEPIFYESLAKKEPNLEVYSVLHDYEFPYLNGGLFEPIRGYDWEKTNIVISDTFFKNDNKTKDGDPGDGLFDVFDRFNFTVHENDSLDQDLAVDPEMLGKVFEKLLPVKERKDSGSFYTPREIVQYMCQESLINYLVTEIGDEISSEALKLFITNHSILEAEDIKGTELEIIVENAIDLDQLLANVKVCDPAVGSGAFPMGMLSEIVSARYSLQPFLLNKQTIYDLKLHTIGQSLYGVDLDPSAVDIARLRFWLSLIIEEDTPIPLPNLEHKLMQGNSLLSSYEGVELFNDQFLVNEDSRQEKLKILDAEIKTYENELKNGVNTNDIQRVRAKKRHLIRLGKQKNKIQAENITSPTTQMLFETDDALSRINKQVDLLQSKIKQFLLLDENSNKEDLKNKIENIKWDLIEVSVDSEGKVKAFQQLKNKRIQPFFLWKLEFIDVFRNHNGFDIVIANPPYISEKHNANVFKPVNDSLFGRLYHQGKMNYWFYFFHLAMNIIKEKSHIAFITPRYWINSKGSKKLINRIEKEASFVSIVDIGKLKVFDNVAGQHMIAIYRNTQVDKFKYKKISTNIDEINNNIENENNSITYLRNLDVFKNNEIILESQNLFNTSKITIDDFYYISQGVVEASDKISKKKLKEIAGHSGFKVGQGIFVLTDEEVNLLALNDQEKSVLKKYVSPSGVNKWKISPSQKNWLIYSDKNIKEKISSDDKFINLRNHLDKFSAFITSSSRPYGIHRPRNIKYFNQPKIIFKGMFEKQEFAIDNNDYFFGMSFSSIISKNNEYTLEYLLGLLNSKYALNWFNTYGKKRGIGVDIGVNKLRTFPLPLIYSKKIEYKVKEILSASSDTILTLESELDAFVYKSYELDFDEIKKIDAEFNLSLIEYKKLEIN
jgi:adenine-specific DNA-methyltransferase